MCELDFKVARNIVLKLWSPNEDFGRMNKRWNADFRSTFQGRECVTLCMLHWLHCSTQCSCPLFDNPPFHRIPKHSNHESWFTFWLFALNNFWLIQVFVCFFIRFFYISTCSANIRIIICIRVAVTWCTARLSSRPHPPLPPNNLNNVVNLCSPNEDFGRPDKHFTPPKRRFWTVGRTFQNAFSKHFSRAWVLDLGYESLKNASKTHSERLVLPSKIFVWGAYISEHVFEALFNVF